MTLLRLLGAGTGLVCVMMLLLWLLSIPLKNTSLVDVAWVGNMALLAWLYVLLGHMQGPAPLLLAVWVSLWALRLGGSLARRGLGLGEEGRYVHLGQDFGQGEKGQFLIFLPVRALSNVFLSLPLALVAASLSPTLSIFPYLGSVLICIGISGEASADSQLEKFKANPANQGRVCQCGLWSWSRHPNYFFELLVWIGYAVFALAAPFGWIGLSAPALMLFFIFRDTGIPAIEAQTLHSKGDAYRQYQQNTSVFIPWPPRKATP